MDSMKKLTSTLIAMIFTLFSIFSVGFTAHAEESKKVDLTILATSDVHGHIYNYDYALGKETTNTGFAKAYSVIKEQRAKNKNVILMDNGDDIQGNMISLFNNEEVHPMIKAMNMMGYDTWELGNHEFNYDFNILERAIKNSKASVLAANVYKKDGTRFVNPYIIKEIDGVRVAIVGMTAPHVPQWEAANPAHFNEMTFKEPIDETAKVLKELDGKYDVLIGSYHYGQNGEYGSDGVTKIAEKFPQFAAIIVGHAHETFSKTLPNGVVLIEPANQGKFVSKVQLSIEKVDGKWKTSATSENIDTTKYAPDQEMLNEFKDVHDKSVQASETVIGKITKDFLEKPEQYPGIPTAQVQDTPLIDFINEVQMFYTKADVSLAALFSSSANAKAGDFKNKDVANIYPYDNTLMSVKVTGKELKAVMEAYAGKYFNTTNPGDMTISFNPNVRGYNYDMFAGVNYNIDISQPVGRRITNVTFKGQPLKDTQELTLALNNYRFGGLVSAKLVKQENKVYDSTEVYSDKGEIRNLITNYIQEEKKGVYTPSTDNNWKIVGFNSNHPLKDKVAALINSREVKIPTSEDGRTPNVKSVNIYDLLKEGKLNYKVVSIIHTNDTHGRVGSGTDTIGFDKIATLVKDIKSKNPNTLVLDAGDTLHGQVLVNLSNGKVAAQALNLVGYDAMTTGNHDYNYGQERLLDLAKNVIYFPVLAANVKDANGKNLFKPYIVKNKDGLKIGIFGLATPETYYKTSPNNIKGLKFEDPVKTATQVVKILKEKEKVDIVVSLAHLGLDESSVDTSKKLAEKVKGIDVIIDGHSHTLLTNGLTVGNTLIAQTGNYSQNVGIVDLFYNPDGTFAFKNAALFSYASASAYPSNRTIKLYIDRETKAIEPITSAVVGKSVVVLNGVRDDARTKETNLADLVTDAMLDASKADLVITNGGGLRTSIDAGDITKGEIISVLPFGNILIVKELKGSDVLKALEHGIEFYPASAGSFSQVAGVKFTFNPNKPVGQKITSVTVGGKTLDPNKIYKVATNDFMAIGGDGYTMFNGTKTVAELQTLDDIVVNYIQKVGTAKYTTPDTRIVVEK